MPDFSKRSEEIEIMDDLSCSGAVVDQSLKELETINRLLGGNHVTLDGIGQLVGSTPSRHLALVDVGCGSGDILRLIYQWGVRRNVRFDLYGIDANPFIAAYADKHTFKASGIQYESLDIFSDAFRHKSFDILTGTLFFHHFTNEQLIIFFSQLKRQIKIGVVINDIHRHWFAYYSIKWLTSMFSRSAMVKSDGPLSVLRAFRKEDLINILEAAGIQNYRIRWMWAFRWQVVIKF